MKHQALFLRKIKVKKQELSSDSIACLDELKGGCNVKSVALIFRSWVWARYCLMKLWPLATMSNMNQIDHLAWQLSLLKNFNI